ncbi:MAG TPA: inorganic diphosphatase [bacterium]|nr:inorganic diphosphatase [Clostridia bacterium]NLX68674.1 inorganic diphosphatase [Clostridiaceae bacterium]HOX40737.1 inorganic diphosphatase [bacterium]
MNMDNVVDALIEIPLHSKNKYEVDHETGKIKLERVLYASMVYPAEYGIIEHTLAPDGDPLDILVISDNPTYPGCYVPARVLGYLEMIDGGKIDYKLISVIDCDPRYDSYHDLKELPAFILKEIKNFFDNYKVLQKVEVTTGDYHDKEEAVQIIEECRARFQEDI